MWDCTLCHSSLVASQSRVRSFCTTSSGVREKQVLPAAASYTLIWLSAVSASLRELSIVRHSDSVSRPLNVAILVSGFGAYESASVSGPSIDSISDSGAMCVYVLVSGLGAGDAIEFSLRRDCMGVVGSSKGSSVYSDQLVGCVDFLFLLFLGVSDPLSAPTEADAIRDTLFASFLVGEGAVFFAAWLGGLS